MRARAGTRLPASLALTLLVTCHPALWSPAAGRADAVRGASASHVGQATENRFRGRLRLEGRHFAYPDGRWFTWRGITAFRLVEQVATGREGEADAYLGWAASQGLTVVRVLAMARELFELSPEAGAAHLPRLLELAARHGLYVEVVALADSAAYPIDPDAHVARIAAICARHENTLLEIANEPYHGTQQPRLADAAYLRRLRTRVPGEVPVALGAGIMGDDYAGGSYVTVHFSRDAGEDRWAYVRRLAEGHALLRTLNKPVVNDEPIGASDDHIPGRRDDSPHRFRAVAMLSRMVGMGATFHYEDGLHARIPRGAQAECFEAWQDAWSLLPADLEWTGTFSEAGRPESPVQGFNGSAAQQVYTVETYREGWALAVGVTGDPDLRWQSRFKPAGFLVWPGLYFSRAERVVGGTHDRARQARPT